MTYVRRSICDVTSTKIFDRDTYLLDPRTTYVRYRHTGITFPKCRMPVPVRPEMQFFIPVFQHDVLGAGIILN